MAGIKYAKKGDYMTKTGGGTNSAASMSYNYNPPGGGGGAGYSAPSATPSANEIKNTKSIKTKLKENVELSIKAGINPKSIIIDPGIGFGKNTKQNINLIKNGKKFKKINLPLMYGVSNKSFIGEILKIKDPKNRINGSIIFGLFCIENGANLLRVHNVKETVEMIKIWKEFRDVRN